MDEKFGHSSGNQLGFYKSIKVLKPTNERMFYNIHILPISITVIRYLRQVYSKVWVKNEAVMDHTGDVGILLIVDIKVKDLLMGLEYTWI